MAKEYTEVGRYPSKSSPGVEYIVKVDEVGELSCNCRGWTMKKGNQERSCPHVRSAAAGNVPVPVTPAPPAPLTSPESQGGSMAKMWRAIQKAKRDAEGLES